MRGYSRAHFRRVSPPSDTPKQIADRLRMNAILEAVRQEIAERWPQITPDNFIEADRYREHRIAELWGAA